MEQVARTIICTAVGALTGGVGAVASGASVAAGALAGAAMSGAAAVEGEASGKPGLYVRNSTKAYDGAKKLLNPPAPLPSTPPVPIQRNEPDPQPAPPSAQGDGTRDGQPEPVSAHSAGTVETDGPPSSSSAPTGSTDTEARPRSTAAERHPPEGHPQTQSNVLEVLPRFADPRPLWWPQDPTSWMPSPDVNFWVSLPERDTTMATSMSFPLAGEGSAAFEASFAPTGPQLGIATRAADSRTASSWQLGMSDIYVVGMKISHTQHLTAWPAADSGNVVVSGPIGQRDTKDYICLATRDYITLSTGEGGTLERTTEIHLNGMCLVATPAASAVTRYLVRRSASSLAAPLAESMVLRDLATVPWVAGTVGALGSAEAFADSEEEF